MKPYARVDASLKCFGSYVDTHDGTNITYEPTGPYDTRTTTLVCPTEVIQGDHQTPNNWSFTKTSHASINCEAVTYTPDPNYGTFTYSGDLSKFGSTPILPDSQRTAAYNACVDKLNGKVRGSLDISVDIAEFGQTRRMLAIGEGVTSFIRKARQHGWRPWVRETGGRHLEYVFGWKPLALDIYDTIVELRRDVWAKSLVAKSVVKLPLDWTGQKDCYIYNVHVPCMVQQAGFSVCKIEIEYVPFDSQLDIDRFTSLNPASIAWELMPYSFVVDWFYNVGNYLRSLETALLYRSVFRTGYVSQLDVRYGTILQCPPYYKRRSFKGVEQYDKVVDFRRTVLSSYPLQDLPTFKADLGSRQLLITASLLAQQLADPRTTRLPRRRWSDRWAGLSFWEKRASDLLLKHGLVR